MGDVRMTETERHDEPFDVGNPNAGIICPWNQNDKGPAKMRVHCLVWKNKEDFDEWASEGNNYFCRVHCMYGRNPEATRWSREQHERGRGINPAWVEAMQPAAPISFHPSVKANPPMDYQAPKRGRKIA